MIGVGVGINGIIVWEGQGVDFGFYFQYVVFNSGFDKYLVKGVGQVRIGKCGWCLIEYFK